jgi:ethanolaminephosphotransferase
MLMVLMYSYFNVIAHRRKIGKEYITPLFGYLPFLTHSAILVFWLHAELRGGVALVHDARLFPFMLYWGMA